MPDIIIPFLAPSLNASKLIILNVKAEQYNVPILKAALKIRVYLSCRLGRLGALGYGPGTYLLRPCGQVAYKTEKAVACLYQSVKTGLTKSKLIKEQEDS